MAPNASEVRDRGDRSNGVQDKGADVSSSNGNPRTNGVASKITRNRKQLHLVRKIFHALAGVAMAAVYEVLLDREQTLKVFGIMFVLLGAGEFLRIVFPDSLFTRLLYSVTAVLARTYEINHVR